MVRSNVSLIRLSLAAAAWLLTGCFPNDSGDKPPVTKPEPPAGLRLAYDTASGVVTVAWDDVLEDARSYYLLTRTDSVDGSPHGSMVASTRESLYRDTLFRYAFLSLRKTSHYRVQTVRVGDSGAASASDPSPPAGGVFPSPLYLDLSLPARTASVRRSDSLPPDTLAFAGLLSSGLPITEVTLAFGKDRSRLAAVPAGLSVAHTPWKFGQETFNFFLDGGLRVLVGFAEPGDYYLHVSARAGRFTAQDSVPFKVLESDPLGLRKVSLGARYHATLGSFLDLDAFRAFASASARSAAADIDLVFAYSAQEISPALYSPARAADSLTTPTGGPWVKQVLGDKARRTVLKKLPGDFTSFVTVADLETLWSRAPEIPEGRILLAAGLAFLVRSDRGLLAALRVVSVDSTAAAGVLTLEGKALWTP